MPPPTRGVPTMIDISVVIPTYNRATVLRHCLAALREQTLDRAAYEIIVVDDASTDETPSVLQQTVALRTFRQARNSGPGAARNVGARAADGRYVLFLDDDVALSPTALAQHLTAHREAARDDVAILGNAVWPPGELRSPFMRYLLSGRIIGSQTYDEIPDPHDVSYQWFISRHLSVGRTFLMQHGLFDEDFRDAYGEDTELGYRLQRKGLRIVYRPDIVGFHHHPQSYAQAKRLRRRAGVVDALMARKHPELADLGFLEMSAKSRLMNWIKRRGTETLLDPILDWADRRQLDHRWLPGAYHWALLKHQAWGLQDAARNNAEASPPGPPGRDDHGR